MSKTLSDNSQNIQQNERIYGRQIAFVAAFLLPASKLLEVPSILAKYAAGDLLLPALLHFFLQFLVLGTVLFAVCRSQTPFIDRLKKGLGKFLPVFFMGYALYYIFAAILPLFDLEKYIYAAFFDTEPTVFSFGFFFILSAFVCTKGIKAVGRCADVCLFLFPFSFFALAAMSISETDFSNLLPLFGSKFDDTVSAFMHTTPHFSDVVLLLPLFCYYQPKKQDAPKILLGYAFGAFCVLLLIAIFFGTFSSIAPREHYAFSKIAQYFPALSVLGRIDLLFIYLLSIVLLFYTCLPLQYSVGLFTKCFKKQSLQVWIAFLLNLSLFLFLLFGNKYYNSIYRCISGYLPIVFFFIADMVPLFLIFLPKYNEKKQQNQHQNSRANSPEKSTKKGEKNMRSQHTKNTVRYYLLLIFIMAFLFFSNDFGLIDVQKTAIVMAVGIDREEDKFILTSQIAIPQSSQQGKATEAVQIVSRGKTIADAFEEINAKTGWYPKLVFCNLIVLGEKTAEQNVFDGLDYFLRDEYLSDNCLVATCDGFAKDLLNVDALVDPSGSVAMQKILSAHAERVGAVLPVNLRDFAIGYFSESRCGFLPIIKTQPQQEKISDERQTEKNSSSQSSPQDSSSENTSSQGSSKKTQDKPVFSAGETALFVDGKRVERLTREESFAFGTVMNKLRLAKYSATIKDEVCTLTIRQNHPKTHLSIGKNDRICFKINVVLTAGIADYSTAQDLKNIEDAGDLPHGALEAAEKKLSAEIVRVFEKCRASNCDLFGIKERLIKYEKKHAKRLNDIALANAIADVHVQFKGIR